MTVDRDERSGGVDLLVDTGAPQHAVAARVAFAWDVPLVSLTRGDDAPSPARRVLRPIIRLRQHADDLDEIAVTEVEIRPETPDTCLLEVRLASATGVDVRRLPTGAQLRVTAGGSVLGVEMTPDDASGWVGGTRAVTVTSVWGTHTVIRDGAPITDLHTPVTLSSCEHRLDTWLA